MLEKKHAAYAAELKQGLAKGFNSIYTHSALFERGAWMCPSCNAIHLSDDFCPFGGRLFPPCCEFPRGGRNEASHYANWKSLSPSAAWVLFNLRKVFLSPAATKSSWHPLPNFFDGAKPLNSAISGQKPAEGELPK
jgi:hypothetical protein